MLDMETDRTASAQISKMDIDHTLSRVWDARLDSICVGYRISNGHDLDTVN